MKINRTLLIFSVLAIGCAGSPQQADDTDAGTDEKSAAEAGDTPPQAVTDALMPSYKPSVPGKLKQPAEERFDINVNRVGARVFFMSLVKGTPVNVVVHPDVSGVISLDLKSVTI